MKILTQILLFAFSLTALKGQSDVKPPNDDDPFLNPNSAGETEEAELARALANFKKLLIPGFEAQISKPSLRFTTVDGEELISFTTIAVVDRITGLLKEAKVVMTPTFETECEDWVQIKSDLFSKQESKVFILYPEFPRDGGVPFSGVRLYDRSGQVSEFVFSSQNAAPSWTRLIKELQAAMKKRRKAEQAVDGNPH